MSTTRSRSRFFYFMNVPLRLVLILFFVLSALNLPSLAPVSANPGGSALQFNGSNQYVTFGTATSTLGVKVFTIETWFIRTGQGTFTTTGTGGLSNAIPLVTKGRGQAENSTQDMNYFFGIDDTTDRLAADFEECARTQTGCPQTASNATQGGQNYPALGTTIIQDNVWYHAAVTFDGRYWQFYLNGNLDGTTDTGASRLPRWDSIQHAGIATAMTSTPAAAGFFMGVIDEARIWNAVRSEGEIRADMYNQSPSGTGLLGQWRMNEGSGTTIANSVGTAQGTLSCSGTGCTLPTWVADSIPPATPTGLTATPGNTTVSLNWNGVSDSDLAGYKIYRSTSSPVPLLNPINGSTLVTSNTYLDEGRTNGQIYYYVVSSVDSTQGNWSATTSEVSATPNGPIITTSGTLVNFASAPGNPSSEQSYAVSGSFLTSNLTVTPPADFEISLSSGSGFSSSPVILTPVSGTVSTTTIYVRFNRATEGTSSGNITNASSGATTRNVAVNGTAASIPNPPSGLTATPAGAYAVTLGWTDNSSNETGFEIQRSTTGASGPYTLITTTAVNAVTYSNTGLSPATEYCYQVRAVNGPSSSTYAGPTCATTDAELSSALAFDGSNDYVTFGNAPGLGLQNFTIETWFRRTGTGVAVSTGSNGVTAVPLVTKGSPEADNSNVDENYILGIRSSDNVLAADFEIFAACNSRPAGDNNPIVGVTPIVNGTWYHAAFTYDGASLRLYLNGNLEATLASTCIPRYDSIQPAGLGTYITSTNTTSGYFAGVLDEVRIWNVARSRADIQTTINSQITSGTGLVARWGLYEGTGTTINSSLGSFSGTLTNGPTWITPGAPFNLVFDTTPPAAPIGLTAVGANASGTLDWADNIDSDLAGYNVYRSLFSGGPWVKVNSTLILASTYIDTGLTNGTEYFYVVRAVDTSTNESADSNETYTYPMADQGAALEFTTASGTYVTFSDPAKLDLVTFTIETWFKRTGVGTPNTTGSGGITSAIPLVTHGSPEDDGGSYDADWVLVIDDSTDVIAADFEDSATGLNHPVSGVTPIVNDTWYHAAATYDGTTWRLYLNGKLETTLVVGVLTPRYDTTQQVGLGTMIETDGTPHGYFMGVVDEARVWDHALTQTEILSNINKQISAGTGLVARWGLNEGGGTLVGDSIDPNANGTITGINYSWVPGTPFNLDLMPGTPVLVAPVNLATSVPTSTTVTVHVTDARNADLTVSFYGRPKQGTPGADFSLIAIPDPQYYASDYPSIYNAQTEWIVDNRVTSNIPFVVSLGDNVNDSADVDEWANATTAWDLLTSGNVPYGLALGNHDGAPSSTTNFNTAFGTRISNQPTFGGRYGTSDYDNTYSLFSAGGMDFIVIFIEYDTSMTLTSNPVLVWANDLLSLTTYLNRRAIVVTHNLLSGNNFTGQGQAIYDALKANPNLFLMLGGHLDTTGQRSDTYNGHTVYSLRSDYQFVDSQQSGYLRRMRFSPANNRIYVTTYSPTQDKFLTDLANQFELPYTMVSAPPYTLIGTASVTAGSEATVTWSGLSGSTEYEWYAVSSNGGEAATSPTWSFTTGDPTAVTLMDFHQGSLTNGVQLDWSTATELGLLGFNLYRSDELAGVKEKLNVNLIPALTPGDLLGNSYQFTDGTAVSGKTYSYWIELVMLDGVQLSVPLILTVPYWIRLPMISR